MAWPINAIELESSAIQRSELDCGAGAVHKSAVRHSQSGNGRGAQTQSRVCDYGITQESVASAGKVNTGANSCDIARSYGEVSTI
jgi:hypothetical protein